ncbi:peptidyl-tRNA hydrolase [Sphaceloma murrayae]|uniref:Mediator of RNA polymerase II transcription subunit 16 n=1 Tax=Sphaceloma murrayae TaxID=2082308 RepID=A0A2K1QY72_9PEZI|nr:peptidyl-tRNA hydrolase [Sphaceloma murrayae]
MPFMDDAMLDLFGEDAVGEGLATLHTQEPESASTLLRLDQQRRSGCCQRLTWSKNATLAYISEDNRHVRFRLVIRDPEKQRWVLSNDSPSKVTAPDDAYFVHIQWSSVGMDLVALDQYGRPHLYQLAYALDRLAPHTFTLQQPADDLSTVVGLHWLPVHPNQFRPPNVSVGSRSGQEWSNQLGFGSPDWPHHHLDSKPAFLLVTESHTLKLYFQQEFGPWSDVSIPLWTSGSPEDSLTHAAFADANKSLYLTVYSTRGSLRMYKITIDWASSQSKDPSKPFQIVNAHLRADYLHGIRSVVPEPTLDSSLEVSNALHKSRLTHLSMLQPLPFSPSDIPNTFQVLALFTYASDAYNAQTPAVSCTAVVRWEIAQEEPELLDVWNTFKAGVTKTSQEAVVVLKRLPDLTIPKIVLGISAVLYEPLLALTFSDGMVQFHNRSTLQPVTADEDDSKAGTYPQAGFLYLPRDKCSDVALTPDACMAALHTSEGRIVLHTMEYMHGWADSSLDDHRTQSALNTIARQVSILTGLQISADEPFALMPVNIPVSHRRYLIKQVYRILQRPVDFTLEENRKMSSRIMRDNILLRILSLHLFNSYTSTPTTLDLPGKIVWTTLNLRTIAGSIAATVTPKEPSRADAVIALSGSVKWCIDLSVLLLDDLANATRHLPAPITCTSITAFLAQRSSPSLLILLSSPPRNLLRMTLELLKIFFTKLTQCNPATVQQRVQVQELVTYYKTLPFKLPHLESVLQEVESSVRAAYGKVELSGPQRVEAEVKMLVDGEVPPILERVVEHVLSAKVAGKVVDSVDQGAVWGWETAWLGLRDGRDGEVTEKAKWDVVRKCRLGDGKKRVCKRCGSLMEDVIGERVVGWLGHAQRNCVCQGYWMVEA